ncbi:dihydrofolate reductase [Halorhodospira neutriphila]|uniref:Dihydrofolate reductase n=1 Tax=Halorhodospira neutriphila TaxID=168379 RepID=A0ABS1E389_9GAMM|nr:dihydrofolate reductase [Halorhodospira neutriphila]MBK1725572.1 diacylglycerol kinase [Halorhodospira neutriphila]
MSEIVLVAIMGRNRVIGADGEQPWHFRCDLERFKALTRGHPVLMGRRTFAAIGRPLPGRTNIVLSRDPRLALEGAEVAAGLEPALERAAAAPGGERIMVIGGGDLYHQCLGRAQRIELTVVDDAPEGDTRFPALDGRWQETAREEAAEGGFRLSFRTYRRAG